MQYFSNLKNRPFFYYQSIHKLPQKQKRTVSSSLLLYLIFKNLIWDKGFAPLNNRDSSGLFSGTFWIILNNSTPLNINTQYFLIFFHFGLFNNYHAFIFQTDTILFVFGYIKFTIAIFIIFTLRFIFCFRLFVGKRFFANHSTIFFDTLGFKWTI